MKKKAGIVRRPAEHVLYAVAALLIVILLLVIRATRQEFGKQDAQIEPSRVEVRDGSLDEIGRLGDEDLEAEEAIITEFDDQEVDAASADAAADNIGGVYDETQY